MARLGSTILRFDTISSTSDFARDLAARGEEEGTAVLARSQTAGRGRLGRSWSSPPGHGLYLSLILRPAIEPQKAPIITLASAVAVAETLSIGFRLEADIKWPNDILVGGKKISGILLEAATEKDRFKYGILGIGINLGQRHFPPEISETATSFFIETGRSVEVEEFLPVLLGRLDGWYRVSIDRPTDVLSRWQEMSTWSNNRAVRILCPEGTLDGITRGLTSEGALSIELSNGQIRKVFSGEVSLRLPGQAG